jgi:hypothetical protein
MRIPYPCYPAEFEIPDDWWVEAGMPGFRPASASYLSSDPAAQVIRLRDIEPPFRFPEHAKDFQGFDRERLVRILSGFVAGAAIEPVPLLALPEVEFQPWPFRYRPRDGFHRFYAAVAAGFGSLPGIVR